jgi:peroxiredoxin Q/BCP
MAMAIAISTAMTNSEICNLTSKSNFKMTTLNKGDQAPNFSGIDQDGNQHQLADYTGKKIVVFFYPKANTPGCTAEACDLRDNFERFQANNYAILGVSADAAKAQLKFKEKFNFPFPLLADEDKSVCNAFGVWGPKKFMGKEYDGIHRTTFIIDEKGIIEEVITDVKTKEHAAQILR